MNILDGRSVPNTIVYQENKENNNRTIIPSFTHFLSFLLLVCSFLPSFVQSLSHSQRMNAWRIFMISMIDLMTGETTRTFAYISDVGGHPNNSSCLRCLRFGRKKPKTSFGTSLSPSNRKLTVPAVAYAHLLAGGMCSCLCSTCQKPYATCSFKTNRLNDSSKNCLS